MSSVKRSGTAGHRHRVVGHGDRPPSLASKFVEAGVGRDAIDPRAERRSTVESSDAAADGDQSLLRCVVGVGVVGHDSAAQRAYPIEVQLQQPIESVAVAASGGVDEAGVVDASRLISWRHPRNLKLWGEASGDQCERECAGTAHDGRDHEDPDRAASVVTVPRFRRRCGHRRRRVRPCARSPSASTTGSSVVVVSMDRGAGGGGRCREPRRSGAALRRTARRSRNGRRGRGRARGR